MTDDDEKTKRQTGRWTHERIAFAVAVGMLWLIAFVAAFYI